MSKGERGKANLPINYQEQIAAELKGMQKRVQPATGDRIRFKGNKHFVLPDGTEGEELNVVIVDFVSSNLYYDSVFNPDSPSPPACFAIGPEPAMLVPSNNSPAKQADTCTACPNNQFKSGVNGVGKACKNTRLLAVMRPDADPDDSQIWIMQIPPTALKSFDGYVTNLQNKLNTVPIGVTTTITLDKTVDYASPRFNVSSPLKPSELGMFFERREEARKRLMAEPDVSQYQPPKPRGGKAGVVRR